MSPVRAAPLVLLALVAPVALAQAGSTVRAVDEGGEVSYRFDPATLAVAPGATVTVRGGQTELHTLTHDAPQGERLFDSGNVDPGGSATISAPSAEGDYPFKCLYHPGMRGTLTVRAAATTTSPTPTPIRDPGPGLPAVVAALALRGLLWRRR